MRSQALSRLKLSLAVAAIPACVVLHSGNAKAVLVYELIPQGSDVQVKVSGALSGLPAPNTPTSIGTGFSSFTGFIGLSNATLPMYSVSGSPSNSFGSGPVFNISSIAASTDIVLYFNQFLLSSSYVQGTPITATGLIGGQTLATLGLSNTSGLLGTWTIGTDSIEVWAGAKPSGSPVPGPLPLLGAGAAFGYSRRLRSRLREASRLPQA